jgi:hypothetical protein
MASSNDLIIRMLSFSSFDGVDDSGSDLVPSSVETTGCCTTCAGATDGDSRWENNAVEVCKVLAKVVCSSKSHDDKSVHCVYSHKPSGTTSDTNAAVEGQYQIVVYIMVEDRGGRLLLKFEHSNCSCILD